MRWNVQRATMTVSRTACTCGCCIDLFGSSSKGLRGSMINLLLLLLLLFLYLCCLLLIIVIVTGKMLPV